MAKDTNENVFMQKDRENFGWQNTRNLRKRFGIWEYPKTIAWDGFE